MASTPELNLESAQTEAIKWLAWIHQIRQGKIPNLELNPSGLPPTFENRVFIGGSYDLVPVLRCIQQIVAMHDKDLRPIFVGDFKMEIEDTYFHSLRLLSQCKRAIFEVTLDGGHIAEIREVAQKKGMDILLVYMANNFKKQFPNTATTMLIGMLNHFGNSKSLQGYTTMSELEHIVKSFLDSTSTHPAPPQSG
jgi:hypothetical protein